MNPVSDKVRDVSIHAPVVGATSYLLSSGVILLVSIHAPVVGATSCIKKWFGYAQCFNPRSRGGSDFILFILIVLFF